MHITHLMYADDVILFSKCSQQGLTSIQSVIQTFCQATGQMVNYSKSSFIFSKSSIPSQKQSVCSYMQIPEAFHELIYLGMPLPFGKSKSKIFHYLISRIQKKTESWRSKTLSRVGKTVMIKSVIQSLSIHVVSCYQLPINICKKFASEITKFLWHSNQNTPKTHWVSWDDLYKQKLQGGFGLRDFTLFNQSLLAKQA